jgi:hypothetical protein
MGTNMKQLSILQKEKVCFITGRTDNLHRHHIYGAANRKISEKYGFWVWLTGEYHNQNKTLGVHFDNVELKEHLQKKCQAKFEETHSREEFMKLIGKNYR